MSERNPPALRSAPRRPLGRLAGPCLAALLLVACGRGGTIDVGVPAADPSLRMPTGLAWLSTRALDGFLSLSARLGLHPGYAAMFARDGRVVHAASSGHADLAERRPMRADTRFRMASMTKPITAVAALLLVEDGRLDLDDPVARFVPAAARLRVAASDRAGADGSIPTVPLARPLNVRDLLTFRAGIGDEEDPSDLGRVWAERNIYAGAGSLAERVDRILTAPLYEQPGERWRYGWAYDVLARVVEAAAGESFDRFLERRIFAPLGMSSTGFFSSPQARQQLATLYTPDADSNLVPVPVSPNDARDWTPGGSGVVSTAGDFMRFALMLWNRGSYDGVRVLSRSSVEDMTRPHVRSGVLADEDLEGLGWGYGVAVVVDSEATPLIDSDGDFWWSGFYGTTFFVSPETGFTGVVLAQKLPGPDGPLHHPIYLAPIFAYWGR